MKPAIFNWIILIGIFFLIVGIVTYFFSTNKNQEEVQPIFPSQNRWLNDTYFNNFGRNY